MGVPDVALQLLALLAVGVSAVPVTAAPGSVQPSLDLIKPKVFLISMFAPEGDVWYSIKDFDVLAHNITVLGFSPLFPDAHCTSDGEICQMTTDESEINAATSIASLVASPAFDLNATYFYIAGIADVNPDIATIGSVAFARYAVQVALQYEIDAREIPKNFSTGYFAQGADAPGQYPTNIYGTEVFEVNDSLRKLAVAFAKTAKLNDSSTAQAYRANYIQAAARTGPRIVECDVATSDVYYSGLLLGETFSNTTKLLTNGTGVYCATAQEDNATLEALLRAALHKKVDFGRIIVMRTLSAFDRPYAGESALSNLVYSEQGAFEPAIANIYLAGIKVVNGILEQWDSIFAKGVKPTNYIGDILGSLGGKPDFGPGAVEITGFLKERAVRSDRRRRLVR